jgi:hypothetical protein
MLTRAVAAALILTGLTLPLGAQPTQPLAWQLKPGDQFYLRTVSTTKQTMKTLGREVRQEREETLVLGFKVESKGPDGIVLTETIEGFSSRTGKDPAVSDDRIKGASFVVTLSPKMEVLKLEGHDKLIDKLAGDDLNVRKTLQLVLSEEALKRSVREALAFLPDRPVKENETWERSIDAPLGPLGSLRMTNTYKLEGKEDVGGKKVEKITYTTALDYKPGKPEKELPYHVVTGDLKAEDAKGTVHFDAAAGRLVQSESKVSLKGKLILSVTGTNVDAELEQAQTTKVTLLNENPLEK